MDTPAALTDADLIPPVEALLGVRPDRIDGWSSERIAGGAGEALGVWRVTGEATVGGAPMPFMLILKGWRTEDGSDSQAWNWPLREARAYASGALEDLPGGIAAPGCLGEVPGGPDEVWAWLTPMSTGALECWQLEHFALVARRLGRFNGAYLTGTPLPAGEWVSRGWTRKWTEASRDAVAQLDAYLAQPLVARAIGPADRREIVRLWEERDRWFAALAALPQVFGHLDAFKRNIFLREEPDGEPWIGLIDWGFVGACAVGEEIAPLVSASVAFGEAAGIAHDALDRAVFEGYVAGLRDAGWNGDDRLARLGYIGSLVPRYVIGPLRLALPLVANEALHPTLEEVFGMTVGTFVDVVIDHNAWAFELADEFRRLLTTVALPDAV